MLRPTALFPNSLRLLAPKHRKDNEKVLITLAGQYSNLTNSKRPNILVPLLMKSQRRSLLSSFRDPELTIKDIIEKGSATNASPRDKKPHKWAAMNWSSAEHVDQ
jgi:hypothetical protein